MYIDTKRSPELDYHAYKHSSVSSIDSPWDAETQGVRKRSKISFTSIGVFFAIVVILGVVARCIRG